MRRILALALMILMMSVSVIFSQTMMDLSTLDLGIQQIRDNTFLIQSINQSNSMNAGKGSASRTGKRTSGNPSRSKGSPNGSGRTNIGSTIFRPVADSIMPKILAEQMGRSQNERTQLEKFFSDLLEEYKQIARGKGALLNDVARALSYDLGNSYDIYNEMRLLETKAFEAMRRQVYNGACRQREVSSLRRPEAAGDV